MGLAVGRSVISIRHHNPCFQIPSFNVITKVKTYPDGGGHSNEIRLCRDVTPLLFPSGSHVQVRSQTEQPVQFSSGFAVDIPFVSCYF